MLYAWPTTASGKYCVVISGAASITSSVSVLYEEVPASLVAVTRSLSTVPVATGVPVIVPSAFSVSPSGRGSLVRWSAHAVMGSELSAASFAV